MEALGDSAMEGGGGAAASVAAAGSAGVWDNSVGVEHDAKRKLMTENANCGRGKVVFMVRMVFVRRVND
jgi:hypothetical protein